eukprot:scaffold34469_cov34-Tisochrysis_lutea.AAC.3
MLEPPAGSSIKKTCAAHRCATAAITAKGDTQPSGAICANPAGRARERPVVHTQRRTLRLEPRPRKRRDGRREGGRERGREGGQGGQFGRARGDVKRTAMSGEAVKPDEVSKELALRLSHRTRLPPSLCAFSHAVPPRCGKKS